MPPEVHGNTLPGGHSERMRELEFGLPLDLTLPEMQGPNLSQLTCTGRLSLLLDRKASFCSPEARKAAALLRALAV